MLFFFFLRDFLSLFLFYGESRPFGFGVGVGKLSLLLLRTCSGAVPFFLSFSFYFFFFILTYKQRIADITWKELVYILSSGMQVAKKKHYTH